MGYIPVSAIMVLSGILTIMKNRMIYGALTLLFALTLALVVSYVWSIKWNQNKRFLEGAVQTGIMMQLTIDKFRETMGRYPTYVELTNVTPLICSTTESVTPVATNGIVPLFSKTGGWFYDEQANRIRINYDGKYLIDSHASIDLSKIDFHAPTRVEMIQNGKSELLDYSYLNKHSSAYAPQIEGIIKSWAVTNKLYREQISPK